MSELVWQDETVQLATGTIRVARRGDGPPLVVLHQDVGHPGNLPLYDDLARRFTVYIPDLPGFGNSDRLDFARHPRDLAIVLRALLNSLRLDAITLLGLGFGGWLAAEMATMDEQHLKHLVLVGAAGIRPKSGFILDQMMLSHVEYVQAGFHNLEHFERVYGTEPSDAQKKAWDFNREMIARVAWRPYMFSLQLPPLLGNVSVPATVVWGRHDRIVPVECGAAFARALPNAALEIVDDAGHFVEIEQPEVLAGIVHRPVSV
ncbi:MAG: alpha/beta fold hydrolase [Dehalococcoidia bacterium]